MDNVINLKNDIEEKEIKRDTKRKPSKRRLFIKLMVFLLIFAIIGAAVYSTQIATSDQSSTAWYKNLPLIGGLQRIAEGIDKQLKGEENDRINILLLGMGGKNHDGAYLTDTIMLVSLEPSTKRAAMISIPRDLAVPIENMGWRKINNVNAFAENNEPGSGGLATSQAVSDLLDVPIDYFVRIDFDGFINIVDELGGVKVNVENTLDDYSYPVLGREDAYPYESRFEHLHVDTGWQEMDGSLALKFARSRHGIRGEGSDFARAKRQQKIIEAVKDKVMTMNILFKPTMIGNIINELSDHISTNLKIWEIVKLWEMYKDINSENITNKVLDNGPNGFLVNSFTPDGAYILSPRSGDFAEIQYMVNNIFETEIPEADMKKINREKPTLEIYNGTWINGLASRYSTDLEKEGFNVLRFGNSSQKNFQISVIYDISGGSKAESLSFLKAKTNANISTEVPDWLKEDIKKYNEDTENPVSPDFILVLGHSADNTASGAENINE